MVQHFNVRLLFESISVQLLSSLTLFHPGEVDSTLFLKIKDYSWNKYHHDRLYTSKYREKFTLNDYQNIWQKSAKIENNLKTENGKIVTSHASLEGSFFLVIKWS